MYNVSKGDLVGFHRRKIPGMGIVMERIDDILDYCEVDREVAFQIAANAQGFTYFEKKKAVDALCQNTSKNSSALQIFFQYNQKWCSKAKVSFVKVKWFKQPAAYECGLRETQGWYPADWVRNIS